MIGLCLGGSNSCIITEPLWLSAVIGLCLGGSNSPYEFVKELFNAVIGLCLRGSNSYGTGVNVLAAAVIGLCLGGSNSKIFFVEQGVSNIKADFCFRLREWGPCVGMKRTRLLRRFAPPLRGRRNDGR